MNCSLPYKNLLNSELIIRVPEIRYINSQSRYTIGDLDGEEWFNIIGVCSFVCHIITAHKQIDNPYCTLIIGDEFESQRYIMFDEDFKKLNSHKIKQIVSNSEMIISIRMVYT